MKYLIKVDYCCETARSINPKVMRWLVIESSNMPKLGVIDNAPFRGGPLPDHGCKKHYDNESCEEDVSCNWQKILEVKPYSLKEAGMLNAKESILEANCRN